LGREYEAVELPAAAAEGLAAAEDAAAGLPLMRETLVWAGRAAPVAWLSVVVAVLVSVSVEAVSWSCLSGWAPPVDVAEGEVMVAVSVMVVDTALAADASCALLYRLALAVPAARARAAMI
jgi:hypothetical protein